MAGTLTERVKYLEGCQEHYDRSVDEIKHQINELTKSHNQVREVVFNGLRDRTKNIETMVSELSKSHPNRKTITLRRILEAGVSVGIVVGIVALVILFLANRLTADDIANILSAWKGG